MAKVFLGLGTNLGDKEENLRSAIDKINSRIGKIISRSGFYATEPWGFSSENSFLNAVVCMETPLSPQEVLVRTQEIEKALGRTHKSAGGIYRDRLIDVDLLLYDQLVLKTETLELPHPLMTERKFVMEPLAEIAPDQVHPVSGKTMHELADTLISGAL